MSEKLWLDDRRPPPWGYSLWAKTADEAIDMLQRHPVEHVSLDHDLAEEHYQSETDESPPIDRSRFKVKTGYAVIEWMEANSCWVQDISIHTLSRRAAEDMQNKIRQCAPKSVTFQRVKPKQV